MTRQSRKSMLILAVLCTAMLALSAASVLAADAEYVGASKCKFCHKAEYEQWQTTAHSKALEALKPEDQKNDKCLSCHVTGYGKPSAEGADLAGVQCEACHGPGSLYKNPVKIMNKRKFAEDPEGQLKLAKEAGLILPGEETCVKCHNENSPTFKGFDFAKMLPKIQHKTE